MSGFLNIGDEVYVLYWPLGWTNPDYEVDYIAKGVVVQREKIGSNKYWYKVKSGNSEYTGIYGIPSSDNYMFFTTEDYINFIKEMLEEIHFKRRELAYEKVKCRGIIKMVEENNKKGKTK